RLDAVRLALKSFHVMEAQEGETERQRMAQALTLASQSVKADPKEAYAHFALARVHFVADQCAIGRRHTIHATEANPYDPVILSILGNFSAMCGDESGMAMVERAYAHRSPGESYARLSLVLAAVRDNDTERLQALRDDPDGLGGTKAAYHHLCETLIAAGLGDIAAARANWRKFEASPHIEQGSDDALLRSIIMSAEIRGRVLAFLRRKGVLDAPER
ncbi:MAG TPA: hypothetical protein VGN36_07670, partial [Sphingorhabdus sp.]|nr:hypothetical protein [Sphingorhabdus sp.]